MGSISEEDLCKVNCGMVVDEVDEPSKEVKLPHGSPSHGVVEEKPPLSTHISIEVDGGKKQANHVNQEAQSNGEIKNQDEHIKQKQQQPQINCKKCAKCKQCLLITLTICATTTAVVFVWYYFGWLYGLPAVGAAIFTVMLAALGWRWFYIAAVTVKRDLIGAWAYIKLLIFIKHCEHKNLSIDDLFQKIVEKQPDNLALISETQTWTFRQLNEFSNRMATLFHSHGYKKGAVVGLMLENRVEYVGVWLGLSKLGIVTAFINTNLRGPSLRHSITVAKCAALIYGEDFTEAIRDIAEEVGTIKFYQLNNEANKQVENAAEDLTTLLRAVTLEKQLPSSVEHPDHHDKLMYIYTSGTTGLPKAAVISHSRFVFISVGVHHVLRFNNKDVFYNPLPLYHTAGGLMTVGQALIFGNTVVIRKKFSASAYFADCVQYSCTIAQYIGEMARYILATPPSEYDRKHKIRIIYGNGLRPQIWQRFVERFNIPKVGEFYGATEGNANIVNNDNTVGAIGFVSRILPQIYPISIIKADPNTGEPLRSADGLCQRCRPGEAGVFIGKIIKGNPSREFLGYADASASSKKIARDVFKKGDMAFLSGDLLTSDERGYLYFMDRTGDTFRWKGENVSTSEVEAQVSNCVNYKDCIVYGVTIAHTEGRAGMAAIYDPQCELDLERFARDIAQLLPGYARPQFLRLLTKIDLTGTCKLRKVDLQKEGYNPYLINDTLYYRTVAGKYELLTNDVYDKINRGEIRF